MHTRDAGQSCVLEHTVVTLKFQNGIKHKEIDQKKPPKPVIHHEKEAKDSLNVSLEDMENHEITTFFM